MTNTEKGKWYTIKVHNGKERQIKKHLEKQVEINKLENNVFEILAPYEKYFVVKKGVKVYRERNFYPGYLFIHADLTGEIPPIIKSVTGVLGFVGAKGEPHPLRGNEIDRILTRIDESIAKGENVEMPYIIGETVKISDGPFANFFGEIQEINKDKQSLKVCVKIFGRDTPLEIRFGQVEKQY